MTGIIGAMPAEVKYLLEQMEDREDREITGTLYSTGKLAGREVVVCRAGCGKVNAAIVTQTMILSFSPDLIVNTGVCGALARGIGIGDVIVARDLVEHDMDTTAVGDPIGMISLGERSVTYLPTDDTAREKLVRAAEGAGLTVREGRIASGDVFVADEDRKAHIVRTFSADACEMEGAAVAHVCYVARVPVAVLRAASDTADGSVSVDYPRFVADMAKKSACVLLSFLASL